jgi:hypothetical protein
VKLVGIGVAGVRGMARMLVPGVRAARVGARDAGGGCMACGGCGHFGGGGGMLVGLVWGGSRVVRGGVWG